MSRFWLFLKEAWYQSDYRLVLLITPQSTKNRPIKWKTTIFFLHENMHVGYQKQVEVCYAFAASEKRIIQFLPFSQSLCRGTLIWFRLRGYNERLHNLHLIVIFCFDFTIKFYYLDYNFTMISSFYLNLSSFSSREFIFLFRDSPQLYLYICNWKLLNYSKAVKKPYTV